jgi:TRAP-type transport system small permease protein
VEIFYCLDLQIIWLGLATPVNLGKNYATSWDGTMAQHPDEDSAAGSLAADLPPEPSTGSTGPLARFAYVLGSAGLIMATASDAFAVAGRHLGFRFIGAIELVQASVVLLACAAMLVVTIGSGHASVHMVTARLRPTVRLRLGRIVAMVCAAVFVALAAGSAWILVELWYGFEQTELLHLPLRWLRLLWVVFALLIAFEFLRTVWRKQGS